MRYGSCLNCAVLGQRQLVVMAMVTESLSENSHHHHAVRCTSCDIWWFDDVVTGAFGQPVPARRDTVMCPCPDEVSSRFEKSVVMIPVPESGCRCTAAEVDRYSVPIRMRPVP